MSSSPSTAPHGAPAGAASPAALDPQLRRSLRRDLGRWFRSEQRDLPWRRTRDPYAIWISEAMLQQTRVETVIPYYERFLARFPDVAHLAAASDEEVLTLWSGLGYYTRARALRRAALAVVERHEGHLPDTRAGWLALPGVGPYTAGAVLSIALGRSEALVDGNVTRVLARLFALEEPVGSPGLNELTWDLARALVPPARAARAPRRDAAGGGGPDPGEWNQALMELGARVCTPRAPRCAECPLERRCLARARGLAERLPRPRPRRAEVGVRLELLLVRRGPRVLLLQRPEQGRMAGLWELPTRELVLEGRRTGLWPARHARGLGPTRRAPLAELAHAITHHRIRAVLRLGRVTPAALALLGPGAAWLDPAERAGRGLTGLTRKALLRAGSEPG